MRHLLPRSESIDLHRRGFLSVVGSTLGGLACVGLIGCNQSANPSPGQPKKWRLGLSSPHKAEILNEFYEDMRKEAARSAIGVDFVIVDADGNAVKQMSDLEAFVAQGYEGIFFIALPSDGLESIVASAVKKGIPIFNHGASPVTGCTQNVVLDQHQSGYEVGKFAARWINEKHGGKAEVGVIGNQSDPWLRIRLQGMKDGLKEHAPGSQVVAETHGHTIELGASGAANMLQAHPAMKILLAHADDPGFGACQAATEAGKINPDQFLVASADGTRLVLDKIAQGGIYQATWSYLFSYSSAAFMRDMLKLLNGEKIAPTRTQGGRLVTKENLNEIVLLGKNAQAPESEKYYGDSTIMRYSETPLTTPKV